MPYALIFDVDGVIADTEPLSSRACSAAFYEHHGVAIPEEHHLEFMGATAQRHAEGIAARHRLRIDTPTIVATHQSNFLDELGRSDGSLVFPGVHELISKISEHTEWRLALATGSSRERSGATIASAGLDSAALAAWVTGDDVHNPKPDPEIYLEAASQLGLFPGQCVVIEDSIAGISAAKGARMHCIAVTNTFPGEKLRDADRIVDSLEDVSVTMLYDLVTDR